MICFGAACRAVGSATRVRSLPCSQPLPTTQTTCDCCDAVTDYLHLDIFGFQEGLTPDGRKKAIVPQGFFLGGSGHTGSCGNDSCSSSMHGGGGEAPAFTLVTKWRENVSAVGGSRASCHKRQLLDALSADSFAWRGLELRLWPASRALRPCSGLQAASPLPPPQDFPYHLEPGIRHLNLWANRPLSRAEVEAHVSAKASRGEWHTLTHLHLLPSVLSAFLAHIPHARCRPVAMSPGLSILHPSNRCPASGTRTCCTANDQQANGQHWMGTDDRPAAGWRRCRCYACNASIHFVTGRPVLAGVTPIHGNCERCVNRAAHRSGPV